MRAEFPEFSTVRIRRLLPGDHHVSSSFSPPCVPHEGEVGAVVDVDGLSIGVECVDATGFTRWFAYFAPEELELVATPPLRAPDSYST